MAAEFCGWLKFLYIDFISCASAGLDFIYHETVQYPIALFFIKLWNSLDVRKAITACNL